MRRFLLVILVLFAALFGYLLLAPIALEPVAWQPLPAPSSVVGPYARNELLKGIERIARNFGKGPEAVAFDQQGRVYTGFDDGRVARFEADGSGATLLANTGGRPLGVFVHPDGSVIVCDADKGLLKIDRNGQIAVLSTTADGVSYRFTDDLAVSQDGSKVYFTDASSKFGYGHSTMTSSSTPVMAAFLCTTSPPGRPRCCSKTCSSRTVSLLVRTKPLCSSTRPGCIVSCATG